MSQAGIVDIEGSHPQIPTLFIANVGSAIPIANTLEILGTAVAAHSVPLQTVGSGDTISIDVQYASDAASSIANNAGVASFDSAFFTVDSNGFVTFNGSAATESFTVDAFTAPGTNPVVPNGSGNVTVTGGQIAAGTTVNVIRTDSLAANTYTIEIQRSQAVASSTIGDNGVSHFDSSAFSVDGNGFVTLSGSSATAFDVQTGTSPVTPTAGAITFNGAVVAAGTHPVRTDGTGAHTMALEVQISQAIAATDATKIGLAAFDSARFTVDANGFVSTSGTGLAETITGQSGGALAPTGGNWNIFGGTVVAGTAPLVTSGSGSTLTINAQRTQAIASTDSTKIGLAAFDSADFTVDANGFVSASSTGFIKTITGSSGGPIPPTANNVNLLASTVAAGTTPIAVAGSGSTLTIDVQKSQAIASADTTKIGLSNFDSAKFTVDGTGFVSTSGTGIGQTITGDIGGARSPTAGNWNIITGQATNVSGSSIFFSGSGSTLTLNTQDANENTAIGGGTGNPSISGTHNVLYGGICGPALTSGFANTGIGYASLNACTTANQNTAVGIQSLDSLTAGNGNICIGGGAGSSYTTTESFNIIFADRGVLGESNTIRLGELATQLFCFIQGITGNTAANSQSVFINSSTGQLGVIPQSSDGQVIIGSSAGSPLAATLSAGSGISISNGHNSITISATGSEMAWTDEATSFAAVAGNGYFITANATATLPASPSQGNTISFAVDAAATTLTIQANTGQVIRIGTAVSASAGTAANNARGDSINLVFRSSDNAWISIGSPQGTWTLT